MVSTKCHVMFFTASTVFDAQDLGFRTILIEDASRGINEFTVAEIIERIKENNGLVVKSNEVVIFGQKCVSFFMIYNRKNM